MSSTVTVIGISGPTNGGKTTLALELASRLPNAVCVHQDDFYKDLNEAAPMPEQWREFGDVDWETVSSINVEALHERVTHLCSLPSVSYVIVEGTVIYDMPLVSLFSRRFLLAASREVCETRRSMRVYHPTPDLPGQFNYVWQCYLDYLARIQTHTTTLHGDPSLQAALDFVLSHLHQVVD